MISINVSKDFSNTPGPRYKIEGSHSAELFLNSVLREKFFEAIQRKQKLEIILDGTAGFATSFLEGSFGELQREYNPQGICILDHIIFVSQEEPYLIDEIKEYVEDAS